MRFFSTTTAPLSVWYLSRLPEAELPKYKALLAALDITELHEALDLTQRLDEHLLAPEQASFEDIARGQLSVITPPVQRR